MRMLLIEDEVKLAHVLAQVLRGERYVVDLCHDGEDGYAQAGIEDYDLIILDIGLPTMDGFEVCRKLRAEGVSTPILMLTARDMTKDKISGLDSGADDYLIKPFDTEELLARIRALLRRQGQKPDNLLAIDSLVMDTKAKLVTRNGREVKLSAREYALLEYFLRNPNQVINKQQLLDHVWGSEVDAFSNVVDVYIGYLRNKIDKQYPKEKPLLRTLKGLGYRLGTGV